MELEQELEQEQELGQEQEQERYWESSPVDFSICFRPCSPN
jgi:hypothetical protein